METRQLSSSLRLLHYFLALAILLSSGCETWQKTSTGKNPSLTFLTLKSFKATSMFSYLLEVTPSYWRARVRPHVPFDLTSWMFSTQGGPCHCLHWAHSLRQQVHRNWSSNEAFRTIGCFIWVNLSRLLNARINRCSLPPLDTTFFTRMLSLPMLSPSDLQKRGSLLLIWALIILHTFKARIKPKERKWEKFSFQPQVTFGRSNSFASHLPPPPRSWSIFNFLGQQNTGLPKKMLVESRWNYAHKGNIVFSYLKIEMRVYPVNFYF